MRRLYEWPVENLARLTHIGQASNLQTDMVPEHRHLGHELVYFAEGTAEVTLHSNHTFRVGPGDLLVVAPNVTHQFRLWSQHTSFCWLGFQTGPQVFLAPHSNLYSNEPLKEVAASTALPAGWSELPVDGNALIHGAHSAGRIFRDLFDEMERTDWHREGIMTLLILELFARTSRFLDSAGEPVQALNSELVLEMDRFIASHLGDEITLTDLARHAGYHPSYLSRHYHELAGKTLSQAIRERRLDRARALLQEGQTVTAVAGLTGFKNIHHFSTVFKQSEGVSPSLWAGKTQRT